MEAERDGENVGESGLAAAVRSWLRTQPRTDAPPSDNRRSESGAGERDDVTADARRPTSRREAEQRTERRPADRADGGRCAEERSGNRCPATQEEGGQRAAGAGSRGEWCGRLRAGGGEDAAVMHRREEHPWGRLPGAACASPTPPDMGPTEPETTQEEPIEMRRWQPTECQPRRGQTSYGDDGTSTARRSYRSTSSSDETTQSPAISDRPLTDSHGTRRLEPSSSQTTDDSTDSRQATTAVGTQRYQQDTRRYQQDTCQPATARAEYCQRPARDCDRRPRRHDVREVTPARQRQREPEWDEDGVTSERRHHREAECDVDGVTSERRHHREAECDFDGVTSERRRHREAECDFDGVTSERRHHREAECDVDGVTSERRRHREAECDVDGVTSERRRHRELEWDEDGVTSERRRHREAECDVDGVTSERQRQREAECDVDGVTSERRRHREPEYDFHDATPEKQCVYEPLFRAPPKCRRRSRDCDAFIERDASLVSDTTHRTFVYHVATFVATAAFWIQMIATIVSHLGCLVGISRAANWAIL